MKGGSTSTGGCDILWKKDPKQAFVAVCLRFGACYLGSTAGVRARDWIDDAADAGWSDGASVLLDPPVGVAV